jgi:PleD family two-component response regulator
VRLPVRTVSTQVPRREDELKLIRMDKDQPRLYRALSRGPFPKSYVGKVFLTAYLAHFAEVLNRNVRAADWVARWGGGEFVVCMWNTQQGQPTEHVLERIGVDLRRNPVVLPDGEEARLTFSGGACQWKPGDDVRGLISRADEAVYRAKGGDTVVYAD